jgi:integrase
LDNISYHPVCMPQRCPALTDKAIRALKPGERRYQVADTEVTGLALRVSRSKKTWVLIGRFGRHPTRRKLGEYPDMSLTKARDEARRWRTALSEGKIPAVEHAREVRRRREHTFASVCDDYFADIKRRGLRRAESVESEMRRELVARWGTRGLCDIDRADVLAVIDETMERSQWQAHHVFSYASRLFNWALERDVYALERSPCDRLRPAKIIGTKEPRTRILSDIELRALWAICPQLDYPIGPLVRLLMLSGQRRSEVAEARWSEITGDVWTISHERMKAKSAHVVPLVPEAVALLAELPRFNGGDYVFSSFHGKSPVNGFTKAKIRIDELMPRVNAGWVLHDIRRTMRTHLSALPGVSDLVRELVIGHTKPGLHKVYDQYAYLDEKRLALTLWTERLRRIVNV